MVFLTKEIKNNIKLYKYIAFIFTAFTIVYSVFITFNINTLVNQDSGRIRLINWKENDLSFFILIGYSMLIGYFSDNFIKKGYLKIILNLLSLILIEAMILTGTRSCLAAIIFILVILSYSFFKTNNNKIQKISILITNLFFFIVRMNNNSSITNRVLVDNLTTFGGRLKHWLLLLRLNNDSPLFGLGLEKYKRTSILEIGSWDPQNTFIEIYGTCGLFGVLCLLSLIVFSVYKVICIFNKTKQVTAIIQVVSILSSLVVFNIWNYKVFFLFLAIFIFNYHKLDNYYSKKNLIK